MSKKSQFSNLDEPLTPGVFYILLSLSKKSRHGYEIMKQVEIDSQKKIRLGPGTLYGAIKRMIEEKLIQEVEKVEMLPEDERRRYYSLTEKGKQLLYQELQRYSDALQIAKKSKLFPNLITKKGLKLAL